MRGEIARARAHDATEARAVEATPDLLARLMPDAYKAKPEQVMLFSVHAWDANCPQHIPTRFEAEDVLAALDERDREIVDLRAQVAKLREQLDQHIALKP